jgi:hypothetical protein
VGLSTEIATWYEFTAGRPSDPFDSYNRIDSGLCGVRFQSDDPFAAAATDILADADKDVGNAGNSSSTEGNEGNGGSAKAR